MISLARCQTTLFILRSKRNDLLAEIVISYAELVKRTGIQFLPGVVPR